MQVDGPSLPNATIDRGENFSQMVWIAGHADIPDREPLIGRLGTRILGYGYHRRQIDVDAEGGQNIYAFAVFK